MKGHKNQLFLIDLEPIKKRKKKFKKNVKKPEGSFEKIGQLPLPIAITDLDRKRAIAKEYGLENRLYMLSPFYRFLKEVDEYQDPQRSFVMLARHAIVRAVNEAKNGDKKELEWLFDNRSNLDFFCELGETSVDFVRTAARKVLKEQIPTPTIRAGEK